MASQRHSRLRIALGAALLLVSAACQAEDLPDNPASFVDVATEVGLDFQHSAFRWDVSVDLVSMMGGGLCWIDYDDDGWLDLFLTNTWSDGEWGRWSRGDGIPHGALYRNDGGEFEDVSEAAGLDLPMRGNGCVAADFDLDGSTDLYVTSDRFNALFWNNGDGTFTEGAEAAGVGANGWQSGAVVGDLNADGWPDMFVAGYADLNNRREGATTGFPNTFLPVRDLLYLNDGPGPGGRATFREVGEALGLDLIADQYEYGLGGAMADFDKDGDLDLYVANDTNPNRLYENSAWPGGVEADPERLGFRLISAAGAGVDDDNSGMGVAAGDYTGDGWLDLLVTNLGSQQHSVYVNEAGAVLGFRDGTSQAAVPDLGGDYTGWGASWVDVDLDTDLDLLVANGAVPVLDLAADAQRVQYLANEAAGGGAELRDMSAAVGLDVLGPLLGRGSAVADFDNDGDLDVAINAIGSPVTLLENRVRGRWLAVEPDGFHPGLQIVAVLPDGTELERTVLAGSSYLSSEDPRAYFGLGDATMVTELRLRWPDGRQSVLADVDANQRIQVSPPD
ncbi:MAG: CRTAC1 family protein [Acidimicrobiia bacterium]|nr:CRTAC1 family protein [Acidimicrobiia bacterium]